MTLQIIAALLFGLAAALLILFYDRQCRCVCSVCKGKEKLVKINTEEWLCRYCLEVYSYLTEEEG